MSSNIEKMNSVIIAPKYNITCDKYMKKYNYHFSINDLEFKQNYEIALNNGLPIEEIIDSIINEFSKLIYMNEHLDETLLSINKNINNLFFSIENNQIPCYITFRKNSQEIHYAFNVKLQGNETYGQIINKIIFASVKNLVETFCNENK